MNPSEYRAIYTVEDRHWWYVGMRHITLALLDEVYSGRSDLRILDAGGQSVQEPVQKDYPDRRGGVKDPAGNIWWISTQVG